MTLAPGRYNLGGSATCPEEARASPGSVAMTVVAPRHPIPDRKLPA